MSERAIGDAAREADAIWSRSTLWQLTPAMCDMATQIAQLANLRTLDALHARPICSRGVAWTEVDPVSWTLTLNEESEESTMVKRRSYPVEFPRRLVWLVVVACCTACGEQNATRAVSDVGGAAFRARACSDVEIAAGEIEAHWIVESTLDVASPAITLHVADLAVAADSTLYVVDRAEARVVHLDRNGRLLRQWGRRGDGPGEFRDPSSIALGRDGDVYVADRQGRITVFSSTGVLKSTILAKPIRDIADLLVLSNGNLVLAADARLGEGTRLSERSGAYVALIDSTGATIKQVLSVSRPEAGVERPLLGHALNRVRLSAGPRDQFAVWYPADNYVEIFDANGVELWHIAGCLPDEIRTAYVQQAQSGSGRQSSVILTLGVDLAMSGDVRVTSFYMSGDSTKMLRIRRYSKAGEIEARDFDVSNHIFLYRTVFTSESTFIAFNSTSPDLGIREFVVR